MQKYAESSASQANWLGLLPSHWECRKIGSLFSERKEKVSDKDYTPLSVTKMGILPQLENAAKSNDGDNRKLVCAGDFVINSRSDRKGSCGVSELEGSVSLINIILTPRGQWNHRYVHYLLRSQPFSEEYYRNGRGIVADLWTTRYSEMKSILLPVPPRKEQDQIVRFLDWKVSSINKLLHIKRQQINQLKAFKKALIKQTVTKGICPTVKYKYSGVDWIGDIPQEWSLKKVKHVMVIEHGRDPVTTGNIPVYGSGMSTFKTCGEYKTGPAVLLGRKGSISNPQYVEGLFWNVDTAFNAYPSVGDFDIRYFYYLSQCFNYDYYTTQTAIPSMTQTDYKNIIIPCPCQYEQRDIVRYLDEKCGVVDLQINKVDSIIHNLNELKVSIISTVVTGKIDVRNIIVPEYEHVDDIADDGSEDASEEDEDLNGEAE